LDELYDEASKNAKIYKVKTKASHDKIISHKSFEPTKKVWLSNSKLKMLPSKLSSTWDGHFVVQQVFPSGAIQISVPKMVMFLLLMFSV